MSTPASLNGKLVPAVSADPTFALAIAITGKIARRLCLQRDDYWKKGIVGYRKRQGTPDAAARAARAVQREEARLTAMPHRAPNRS